MSKKKNKGHKDASSASAETERLTARPGAASAAAFVDTPEPTAGNAVLPIGFFALLALLLYAASMHLANRGGEFNPQVYYPFENLVAVDNAHPKSGDDLIIAKGRTTYRNLCMPCHQDAGQGLAGQFPPLAGSEWVLAEGPARIIRVVLHGASGPIEVKGAQFNNAMVPWKDVLKDEDIAAVLSYVRNQWGNKAPIVVPDQVKAVRAKEATRENPWTADELKQIPEKL